MLFTSFEFIALIAISTLLYYLLPSRYQWKVLLLSSYLFYFIAGPQFLPFILMTTLSAYFLTIKIWEVKKQEKEYLKEHKDLSRADKKAFKQQTKKIQKKYMGVTLLINLGILAIVKYTNFTIYNINYIFDAFGSGFSLKFMDLIVPLGISFYTFQTLSYVIDVYNNRYAPEKNLGKFALFVSFFPQLVQGPISRYGDISETLYAKKKFGKENFCFALQRIGWGYFKKLVIADRALIAVNIIINGYADYDGFYVLVGMLMYALQLYADFTGGIDITIGVAQLFGVKLKENFERPYFSKNIKEYWNRWHITMGTWFTDYIFYPVSISKPMLSISKFSRKKFGDKIGKRVPVYMASIIVWFITGVWHGASWNFIAWGLTNCLVILVSQECEPLYEKFHEKFDVLGKTSFKTFQVVRTVLLMSCIRSFDCYRDVPLTFKMLASMFTRWNIMDFFKGGYLELGLGLDDYILLLFGVVVLTLVSLKQRAGSVRVYISQFTYIQQLAIWYLMFLAILLFGIYGIGYEASQFIYNQF